jgi:hypothetical protein
MTKGSYAPPADDGGGQGSFTKPEDMLAQSNAQDPGDRGSVGSLWNGAKDQARARGLSTLPGRSARWIPFSAVWKAQGMMLLMLLLFSAAVVIGALTSNH